MTVRPALVSGIVLAAGSARRMNGDKLVLGVGGKSILRRVVEEAVAADLLETLVIVSPENRAPIARAIDGLPATAIVNPAAAEGMGGSIALGAGSVAPEAEALVVLQGDQPLVGRDMVRRLVAELTDGAPAFVASRYGSVVTTPVLFSRVLFGELRALGGDRGARAILERHAERGRLVAFPEWRGADVDTPADYERVRDLFAARGGTLP